jgi:transposase
LLETQCQKPEPGRADSSKRLMLPSGIELGSTIIAWERPVFYTGIDQHRRSSVLTTVTPQGERLSQVTLPNERGLLSRYFAQFPGPHHAVVEATGRWYWLRDLLAPQGIDLHLAHAKFLKAIAYAKVKTDAVDSDTLAQLLRAGLIPEAHMIAEAQRGPRDVLRARLRLVERRSRSKNSLDRLLEKFNVQAPTELPPLYQLQAELQLGQIALLTEQIRTLEHAIQGDLLETPAIQRLLWIPGIGRIVAFTLALEVDDIQRFPTVRHFWSYCRLVPGAADSAGRQRHRASKDGNRYLKLAFSHATVRAIQYFPEVRQWYQRWKRKKPLRIARALVAKELAKCVYVVLHDQVEFNHHFKGTPLTRQKQARWPRRASPSA